MKRWISSACCTLCLLAIAFLLPVWSVPRQLADESALEAVSASTVALIQRPAAAPPPVVQSPPVTPKPAPPHIPTIPSGEEVPPEPVVDTAEPVEPLQDEPPPEEASAAASGAGAIPATAQEAATASTESPDPAALQYRQYVLSRIASRKTYPRAARTKKQEGIVRLQVVIGRDGRLMDCKIVSPCQHSLLNEASLLAVEKAAPFKKMPAGMDTLTLTFAIDYNLQ